jgi:hypothetical protein
MPRLKKFEDYIEILLRSAESALEVQRPDGSFPAGRNNKWNDIDTSARTTSHFAIQLCFAYRYTSEKKYLSAAKKCGDFLQSSHIRPGNKTFLCRISPKKDLCNGLIGQAWVIEALIHLYETTNEVRFFDLARDVYGLHPFSSGFGLYEVIDCDGTNKGVAKTLNHQLIFSAMGMRLITLGADEFRENLLEFFTKLPENMHIDSKGLLHHHVNKGRNSIEKALFNIMRYAQRKQLIERSQGYQSFNMFGLALAKRNWPNCPAWSDPKLSNSLDIIHGYTSSKGYANSIKNNAFALAFRLTAQEILLFEKYFNINETNEALFDIIDTQFKNHWNFEKNLLNRNTEDPHTLSSRLYEMWYLFENN